ncbi:Lrp/AsnC family transcriptional regulator [Paenarthrobacter sp. NPDC092416]|uniref:Lrp/AsnC family transcriptional regulator n=1 Tax=Paenarthrobacter sp. NPDC092416 TaxID=3364386 RepID=UPI0037F94B9C
METHENATERDSLQESEGFTERDLELITALQVAPRASWEDLAGVLGVHASTLSRRWSRLVDSGLARTSVAPGPELSRLIDMAFVELTCQNSKVQDVVDHLMPDERLMSIQFVAGSAHLLLTVAAAEHGLADFLLTTIGSMDGVLHYAVRSVTSQIFGANKWHFRALPAGKLRELVRLHQESAPTGESALLEMSGVNRTLIRALAMDGRASFRELAAIAGISPVAAARRVGRLIGGGYINVRCDVARRGSGRSFSAVLWGSMEPRKIPVIDDGVLERIAALRIMATVTGSNNIHMVAWLNNPLDLPQVEQELLDAIPGLTIDDRRIVLRTFKYNGARLNADGTFGQVFPMAY